MATRINTNKAGKKILDQSMLEEEFFEDTLMMGIVCPYPSYRMAWTLNQAFDYQFARKHEYEIHWHEKVYEVYEYQEPDTLISHVLYTHRKGTNYMMEEAKNIDFFWLIRAGHGLEDRCTLLLHHLQDLKGVVHCFRVDNTQLRSKQLLIL